MEPPKNSTSETTTSSPYIPKIDIEKSNQLKIPKRILTDSNITVKYSKNSIKTIKNVSETKKDSIKNKSKNSKQLHHGSAKSVVVKNNPSDVKNNKPLNISTYKNATILNDSKKNKTSSIKKNESLDQQINSSSCLHTKPVKILNKSPQKDLRSKLTRQRLPIKHRQKSENKVEKSNIKSVVIKDVQDNKKCNIKTKHNQIKSYRDKQSTSYASSDYKENYKDPKCSLEKIKNPVKKIKDTKKRDKQRDLNKVDVLKKVKKYNTEKKIKEVSNKPKTSDKSKTKERILHTKSDVTSNKKSIKSPIKRKTSKTKSYRKIKLVINLICNKNSNPLQHNDSSTNEKSGNKSCTVTNVDLDFLNDFDIDEIVESLDTCEQKSNQNTMCDQEVNKYQQNVDKHSILPNMKSVYSDNTDATDLIKILKGEEDDDLLKISIENVKELLFSNVVNTQGSNDSQANSLGNVSNSDERTISKDITTGFLKTAQKRKRETFEMVSSITPSNLDKNVEFIRSTKTCDIYKHGTTKETQVSIMKKNEDIKDDCFQSQTDNNSQVATGKLSQELVDTISTCYIKEEQNINNENPDPLLIFNNVDNNSYACISGNKNQVNIACDSIYKNHFNDIVSENVLQNEINNKDNNCSKESIHHQEIAHDLNQEKPKDPDNELNVSAKQEKQNTNSNNEKCFETYGDENDSIPKKSVNQKLFEQPNANTENEENQNSLTLNNNNLQEKASVHDSKVQTTTHEDNKEKQNDQEVVNKNNKNALENNDTETKKSNKPIPGSDEHTHSNTKTKDETILNLEGRLHNISGSKYAIQSVINNGRYSDIFKCKHPNGKYYALKMATTKVNYCNSGKEKKDMLYSLLNDIPKNNLCIVNLVKAFNFGEKWCFLMDYYPKNLEQALQEAGKPFSIECVQDYARQLVMAVMVLRNKNMVHLDVKPKHILINSSNNMLKLCGFDSLCYEHKMIVIPSTGTVNYRAPEVILGYRASFEIDVWSTALVLFEMATNKKLFPGIYNNDILYKQICTLGFISHDMVKRSKFGSIHFSGSKFMRRSGFKGQIVHFVSKFYKNNKLRNSINDAYYENWGRHRNISQQNSDFAKIDLFVTLLQKMLTMQPEARLPIEFVCANTFIYNAYSYQEW